MIPVKISGMGSELQGVGRLEDGKTVFVPGALPGETVSVRILKDKGRYCEAELLNVLSPSPERITPECRFCGDCGGCRASNMNYQATLAAKKEKVVQAFKRVGGFESVGVRDVIGMDDPFRYRNKAEYAVSGGRIGLRPNGGRSIIEIDDCLLQSEPSVKAMLAVRKWLAKYGKSLSGWLVTRTNDLGEIMCVLSTAEKPAGLDKLSDALFSGVPGMRSLYAMRLNREPKSALDGTCEHVAGEKSIRQTLAGLVFEIGPMSFFQVNVKQAEKLYGLAVEAAQMNGVSSAIDAYCGVGTITLSLAKRAGEVVGVESICQAVEDAGENARLNGLAGKTRFIAADAAKEIPRILKSGFKADAIVVDPPRRGVDAGLIDAIVKSGVSRIVYVSCDAATLARDMAKICADGRYEMGDVNPVDMFSWTSHIECVTCAVKRL